MSTFHTTYNIDAAAVIRLFGGRQGLPTLFEKHGLPPITIAQTDKWRHRRNIPGEHIVALTVIAKAERIKFDIAKFVTKQELKREPLSLPQSAA